MYLLLNQSLLLSGPIRQVIFLYESHMPETPKEQPGVDKEVSGHSVAEEGKLPLLSDEEVRIPLLVPHYHHTQPSVGIQSV